MTQRVAVVTGGTGGLGSEICKALARAGRRVIAADLPARMTDAPRASDGLDIHFERWMSPTSTPVAPLSNAYDSGTAHSTF